MDSETRGIIMQLYFSFNERKADDGLAVISRHAKWVNTWEGGYAHGHSEIRNYWTRYWNASNIYAYPIIIKSSHVSQFCEVNVLRVVRDMDGRCLEEMTVWHYFTIENQLIRKFDVIKSLRRIRPAKSFIPLGE